MSNYTLADGLYLYPTPSGAYYAFSSPEMDKPRYFLQKLLQQNRTPELSLDLLSKLAGLEDEQKALELLHHCQKLGWLQGVEQPIELPQGALEDILPALLDPISASGKVLLADDQGFYLATSGFPHEVAEELSALSADLASLHKRRAGLLVNNMGITSHAWAMVDAFGNSRIGFWPVFMDKNRFVIIISGIPHFNRPEFVSLIWVLSHRYNTKNF